MKKEPLKNKIDDAGHFNHDTKVIRVVDVKSAVEFLRHRLKGQCEYEDEENKKYIHSDETINRIIEEAFADVVEK